MKVANKTAILLLTRVFALLVLFGVMTLPAQAQAGGQPSPGGAGNTAGGDALDSNPGTAWDIRKNYFLRYPVAQEFGPSEAGGSDVIQDKKSQGPGMVMQGGINGPLYMWPVMIPTAMSQVPTMRDQAIQKDLFQTFGLPVSDTQFQVIARYNDNRMLEQMFDPEKIMWLMTSMSGLQVNSAANSSANMAVNQSQSAIDFTKKYLVNFTAQAGNRWHRIRDQLFIPMAILLLLPGAVAAQANALVKQGSPILGEASPFEGIMRSIIATFLIPATFLVINYGIDVANSITYTIADEYRNIFGTDMYDDAQCAEMRAFPINAPQSNNNAIIPGQLQAPSDNQTAWNPFEQLTSTIRLKDPCANLDESRVPDESAPQAMNLGRFLLNNTNVLTSGTWNVLCAFQMAFLYYLWCMGPIAAALWVWPIGKLRQALPSWIEGVVTLCFWSLFWNTTVLLMACFRGVGDNGLVIMSALNTLATICVKYAFDFSGLISGAGSAAASGMNSAAQAAQSAAAGGGKGGGAGAGAHGAAGAAGAQAGGHPPGVGGGASPVSLLPGGPMSKSDLGKLDGAFRSATAENMGMHATGSPLAAGLGASLHGGAGAAPMHGAGTGHDPGLPPGTAPGAGHGLTSTPLSGHNAGANMAALGGAALAGAASGHAPTGISPTSLSGQHPPGAGTGAGMTRSAASLGSGTSGQSGLHGQHGQGTAGQHGPVDAKTQAEMAARGLNPDGSHMTQAQLNALGGDGPPTTGVGGPDIDHNYFTGGGANTDQALNALTSGASSGTPGGVFGAPTVSGVDAHGHGVPGAGHGAGGHQLLGPNGQPLDPHNPQNLMHQPVDAKGGIDPNTGLPTGTGPVVGTDPNAPPLMGAGADNLLRSNFTDDAGLTTLPPGVGAGLNADFTSNLNNLNNTILGPDGQPLLSHTPGDAITNSGLPGFNAPGVQDVNNIASLGHPGGTTSDPLGMGGYNQGGMGPGASVATTDMPLNSQFGNPQAQFAGQTPEGVHGQHVPGHPGEVPTATNAQNSLNGPGGQDVLSREAMQHPGLNPDGSPALGPTTGFNPLDPNGNPTGVFGGGVNPADGSGGPTGLFSNTVNTADMGGAVPAPGSAAPDMQGGAGIPGNTGLPGGSPDLVAGGALTGGSNNVYPILDSSGGGMGLPGQPGMGGNAPPSLEGGPQHNFHAAGDTSNFSQLNQGGDTSSLSNITNPSFSQIAENAQNSVLSANFGGDFNNFTQQLQPGAQGGDTLNPTTFNQPTSFQQDTYTQGGAVAPGSGAPESFQRDSATFTPMGGGVAGADGGSGPSGLFTTSVTSGDPGVPGGSGAPGAGGAPPEGTHFGGHPGTPQEVYGSNAPPSGGNVYPILDATGGGVGGGLPGQGAAPPTMEGGAGGAQQHFANTTEGGNFQYQQQQVDGSYRAGDYNFQQGPTPGTFDYSQTANNANFAGASVSIGSDNVVSPTQGGSPAGSDSYTAQTFNQPPSSGSEGPTFTQVGGGYGTGSSGGEYLAPSAPSIPAGGYGTVESGGSVPPSQPGLQIADMSQSGTSGLPGNSPTFSGSENSTGYTPSGVYHTPGEGATAPPQGAGINYAEGGAKDISYAAPAPGGTYAPMEGAPPASGNSNVTSSNFDTGGAPVGPIGQASYNVEGGGAPAPASGGGYIDSSTTSPVTTNWSDGGVTPAPTFDYSSSTNYGGTVTDSSTAPTSGGSTVTDPGAGYSASPPAVSSDSYNTNTAMYSQDATNAVVSNQFGEIVPGSSNTTNWSGGDSTTVSPTTNWSGGDSTTVSPTTNWSGGDSTTVSPQYMQTAFQGDSSSVNQVGAPSSSDYNITHAPVNQTEVSGSSVPATNYPAGAGSDSPQIQQSGSQVGTTFNVSDGGGGVVGPVQGTTLSSSDAPVPGAGGSNQTYAANSYEVGSATGGTTSISSTSNSWESPPPGSSTNISPSYDIGGAWGGNSLGGTVTGGGVVGDSGSGQGFTGAPVPGPGPVIDGPQPTGQTQQIAFDSGGPAPAPQGGFTSYPDPGSTWSAPTNQVNYTDPSSAGSGGYTASGYSYPNYDAPPAQTGSGGTVNMTDYGMPTGGQNYGTVSSAPDTGGSVAPSQPDTSSVQPANYTYDQGFTQPTYTAEAGYPTSQGYTPDYTASPPQDNYTAQAGPGYTYQPVDQGSNPVYSNEAVASGQAPTYDLGITGDPTQPGANWTAGNDVVADAGAGHYEQYARAADSGEVVGHHHVEAAPADAPQQGYSHVSDAWGPSGHDNQHMDIVPNNPYNAGSAPAQPTHQASAPPQPHGDAPKGGFSSVIPVNWGVAKKQSAPPPASAGPMPKGGSPAAPPPQSKPGKMQDSLQSQAQQGDKRGVRKKKKEEEDAMLRAEIDRMNNKDT